MSGPDEKRSQLDEDERIPVRQRLRGQIAELAKRGKHVSLKRYMGHALLLLIIALGAWAAQLGLTTLPADASPGVGIEAVSEEPVATKTPDVNIADLHEFAGGPLQSGQIDRRTNGHTVFPSRPRLDVIYYEVKSGDTLFGIAERYGVKPETILWGNFEVLEDNPHSLQPGQELRIPPIDGTLHVWSEGEGLSGIADFFDVTIQDILDWPGNHLNPDMDLEEPTIEPGTVLMIPGGRREYVSWTAPRIPRTNPGVARILGPGYCGTIYDGPIGVGSFIWPTPLHYLSGYDYSPATNHYAIDIAGQEGHSIFSADAGVVVYSGWHNGGYGNVIVLDHGNGWQSLYAHLSAVYVGCGAGVFQGTAIGAMGTTGRSTGPHLHFEMMHDVYGRVNPWNFLP
ncbi:MAG: peptidoglycan DD-metalloendopeptidase family protein [Anaerolineales bacterium]|nr:peptidoglycan DD-metalloendopeptidase family protein [Anaerolineales bacterium]